MTKAKISHIWSQTRLPLAALITGASIMVTEIVGARIIAPSFGSSVYVWTAVIGVILGALAIGYFYGGRLADRTASRPLLSVLLTLAALLLFLSLEARGAILAFGNGLSADPRIGALVSALLLFAPVNVLLGMASPFFTKLTITSLKDTGRSVGRIEAAGTAGSILGTFLTGYFLLGLFGSRSIGLSLVIVIVGCSFIISTRRLLWLRAGIVIAAVLGLTLPASGTDGVAYSPDVKVLYDGDSAYSRYRVVEAPYGAAGRANLLLTDNLGAQSGVLLEQPGEPAFGYARRFLQVTAGLADKGGSQPRRMLVIGGGAYTLPTLLADRYPQARVDVVEIDPKLDELARQYFGFRDNPRINIVHEDGRTFINRDHAEKYDVVYVDAYQSLSPPFQLTTVEAVRRLAKLTTPNGIVVANVIAGTSGRQAEFLDAVYSTYGQAFANRSVSPVYEGIESDRRQNLVLLAAKNDDRLQAASAYLAPALSVQESARPLTDDFAPVDALTAKPE